MKFLVILPGTGEDRLEGNFISDDFCSGNYHGGNQQYLVADLDSNGWPQVEETGPWLS